MISDKDALDWANANPKDPRSQNIKAKVWANQNPDDPRSIQILDKISKANSTPPEAENAPQQASQGQPPAPPPQPNAFNVANNQQTAIESQTQHVKDLINKPYAEGGMALNGQDVNQMASNMILPGMAAKLPMAASALGRLGIGAMTGATQGAVNSPGDAVGGAAAGGIAGGVGGSILEGIAGLLGGIKGAAGNLTRAKQLSDGSPQLQQEARGMMRQAADKLAPGATSSPSQALNELPSNSSSAPVQAATPRVKFDPFMKSSFTGSALQKAQVPINVAQYMGKNPEVDAILTAEMAKASPNGHQVAGLNVSGDTLNTIQQKLAQTGTVDPSAKALSGLGDADSLRQASFLNRRAQSSPVSTLSNDNFDNRATLKDISNKSGVDLSGYASQLASAAKTADSPLRQGPIQTAKQGIKGIGKSISGPAGAVNDPRTLSAILSLLMNK